MTPAAYTEANARRLAAAALRRLPGVTCVLSGLWVQAILKDGAEEVNHNGKDEIELRLRPTDSAENFSAIFVKFLVRNTRRRPFFRHLSGERCRLVGRQLFGSEHPNFCRFLDLLGPIGKRSTIITGVAFLWSFDLHRTMYLSDFILE